MSDHPVAPDAPPARRFAAVRQAAPGVAAVAAAGVAVVYVLDFVTLPAWVGRHGVALAIAAAGGITAIRWVRRGVRRQLRAGAAAKVAEFGGGIYGSLAFATLLYLETLDLAGDVAAVGSLRAFVGRLDVGWLVSQAMESVGFAIQAAMWPWYWFDELGPATAGLVAGGVWALNGAASKLWERRRGPAPEPLAGVAGSEQNP